MRSTLLVVSGTIVAALLSLNGAFDPPVAGPLLWSDRQMAWAPANPTIEQGEWADAPTSLPLDRFTLRVEARLQDASDPSVAWGVWLETTDGGRVIYAISGKQYLTTRLCEAAPFPLAAIEDCPAVRPEWRWFEYNRLHRPGKTNTITLHREDSGEVRLRLNDERMGISPVDISGRWGVWVRGEREGDAVLVWEKAAIYGQK